ncbi:hypothetical protein [Breznakiella homolactica]|uniref:DUF5050 domain-containing protein n=1 Tax=Breznakiella homolactica TaxID=2798577 RepID=A0A7T7XNJ6_9SPIR|nr:hypothetical protein [Breznakiella homolactica]QQO09639.1 hypothetical protein JFL75_01595 [Breznakiella homolactica]
MKGRISILIPLIVLCCLIGCDNPSSGSSEAKKLSLIDITGAKALMVAPGSAASRSSSGNQFLKILSDGTITQVNMVDESGSSTSTAVPSEIHDVTDEYMIIIIENNPYLVSKTTGSAYDLSPVGSPQILRANMGYNGEVRKSFYSDKNGNIYYLSAGIVKKINISNPNSITASNYTPDIYNITSADEFCVDSDGNVLFSHSNGTGNTITRFKTTTNSIKNLNEPRTRLSFTGYDGNIYFQPDSSTTALQKLELDVNNNLTYTDYGTIFVGDSQSGIGSQGVRWLYFDDMIITIGKEGGKVVYKTGGVPRIISVDLSTAKYVSASNAYYYVATENGRIIKINPNDDAVSELLGANNYDIFKMTVTNDDEVIFNALRYSDSKKLLIKINSDGTIEQKNVIDVGTEITVLEKVN